jgi:hypothetical protein
LSLEIASIRDTFTDMKRVMGFVTLVALVAGCGTGLSELEQKAALEQGAVISDASFQGLSARLQKAMNEGGPAHAVEFCSLNAMAIVDSLSAVHGARIRRTSDRVRSPYDKPDDEEANMMHAMLTEWEVDQPEKGIQARAVTYGDSIAYYRPIFISSPACLKCHGVKSETADASALDAIAARYPGDEATGYQLGELRGMWSIRWAR